MIKFKFDVSQALTTAGMTAYKAQKTGVLSQDTWRKIKNNNANISTVSYTHLDVYKRQSGIKGGANTVILTAPLTITANKQLSVKVTDSDKKEVTAKTGTFNFVSSYYYGAIAADATATEEIIKAATKSVTAKGNKTFSFTCNNQKMLFAYPKSYGNLSKILDANSFDVTGTFTKTEVTVGGVAYYAYVNSASTVSSFKMTFNY